MKEKEKGFTLIEVLIALLIISVASAVLYRGLGDALAGLFEIRIARGLRGVCESALRYYLTTGETTFDMSALQNEGFVSEDAVNHYEIVSINPNAGPQGGGETGVTIVVETKDLGFTGLVTRPDLEWNGHRYQTQCSVSHPSLISMRTAVIWTNRNAKTVGGPGSGYPGIE